MIGGWGRHLGAGVAAVAWCGLLAAAACGTPAGRRQEPGVVRLVDGEAEQLFASDRICRSEEVFEWLQGSSATGPRWSSTAPGATVRSSPEGLVVQLGTDSSVTIEAKVKLDAASVDVVDVVLGQLPPGAAVSLLWSPEGEGYSLGASLRPTLRRGTGGAVRTFSFRVGAHPRWKGTVTGLRVGLSLRPSARVVLHRLIGRRLVVVPELLADALGRLWLVDLHGEIRTGVLALPGLPVERELVVPPGGRFGTTCAIPPTVGGPVRFRAVIQAVGGTEVALTDLRLDPVGEAEQGVWHEQAADLEAWVGQPVRIRLEVTSEHKLDPVDGLPVWGQPEVVGRAAGPGPPNLFLVSIDTLRADRVSLYGYPRATSPELDRWARARAVMFRTVVAPSPWTLPSHVSMLTGLDALRHGVNHAVPAPATLTTLAELLHRAGYETAAVTGGSYLHPEFGLGQGFDLYRSIKGGGPGELEEQVAAALRWLDRAPRERPFFLFFHTYEVHDPYLVREPYFATLRGRPTDPGQPEVVARTLPPEPGDGYVNRNELRYRRDGADLGPVPPDDLQTVVDLYDSSVAYTDAQLARLLARLEERGLADRTVVAVTSDHGESLGEHGLASHTSLFDHDLLVPLLLAVPGQRWSTTTVDRQVRLVDLMPTLLDLAGVEPPAGLDGCTLVPLLRGRRAAVPAHAFSYAALSNFGLGLRLDGAWKYQFRNTPWRPAGVGPESVYDLARDPAEEKDLAATATEIGALREKARGALVGLGSGLRLQLSNTTTGHGSVLLQSPLVTTTAVKTADLVVPCEPSGPDQVRCDLPAGASYSLVIEKVETPVVQLGGELRLDGTVARFSLERTVEELERHWAVILREADAVIASGEVPVGHLGVGISWVGAVVLVGGSPADRHDEVREQLKALGYVQ